MHPRIVLLAVLPLLCPGCAVVTEADAAVSVVGTTVKVGATVVETAVDVTAEGVKAVVGNSPNFVSGALTDRRPRGLVVMEC